jgi:3',5'-cyclic AMP phosphodiesterase CpdA
MTIVKEFQVDELDGALADANDGFIVTAGPKNECGNVTRWPTARETLHRWLKVMVDLGVHHHFDMFRGRTAPQAVSKGGRLANQSPLQGSLGSAFFVGHLVIDVEKRSLHGFNSHVDILRRLNANGFTENVVARTKKDSNGPTLFHDVVIVSDLDSGQCRRKSWIVNRDTRILLIITSPRGWRLVTFRPLRKKGEKG